MNNEKKFALRMTAMLLCMLTISASLSSCGYFSKSYLENYEFETRKESTKAKITEVDITTEEPITPTETELATDPPIETTKSPETTKKPETTSAPETTLSPEQLDNIPDDVQYHVYLTYKNTGRCEELIGNAAVTVVMVSDEVSAWNDAELNMLSASLSEQENHIEDLAASYGKKLNITFNYVGAKVTGDAAAGDYSDGWLNDAAKSIGYESLKQMQKDLDNKSSADSNPILFVLNKTGRAYANRSTGTTGTEYLVLFSSDYSAFNHELYHVYGADDFYYPDEVKELAATYLTDSIMSNGKLTDSLTAFVIGWDDEMDKEAYEFLKKTSHITQNYLEEANKAQSITGYVTNHKLSYGIYTGYLERGVPTGEGTLTYDNGNIASGIFLGGSLQGEGSYTWANGNKYVGFFNNGDFDGYGVYTTPDGYRYEGDWSNGKRHGKGKAIFTDFSIYEGDWVNGERSGNGKYIWSNGNKYVGSFKEGKFDGHGIYTTPDGYKYDGSWKNDKREGYGSAIWTSGNKYEGNWSDNQLNGNGTYIYADGDKYVGNFVDGKFEGQGTYTSTSGYSYIGTWKNGSYNGYGTSTWANGTYYEGYFVNGQRHGEGTYYYAEGHKYIGSWVSGERNGQGYMIWSDGSSYEGEWKDSKRHGYGKYINQNGKIFEGQWENDVFQG